MISFSASARDIFDDEVESLVDELGVIVTIETWVKLKGLGDISVMAIMKTGERLSRYTYRTLRMVTNIGDDGVIDMDGKSSGLIGPTDTSRWWECLPHT